MDCLSNVSAEDLSQQQFRLYEVPVEFPFGATLDGQFLPVNPEEALQQVAHDKQLLMGNNEDEGEAL